MPSKPPTPLQAWKRRFMLKSSLLVLELAILWTFLVVCEPKWPTFAALNVAVWALLVIKSAWLLSGLLGYFATIRRGKSSGKA